MSVFKAIGKKLAGVSARHSQRQVREQLLGMSARQLEDLGISRGLLLEGISAWPWRVEPSGEPVSEGLKQMSEIDYAGVEVFDAKEIKRATKELNAFSDRELAELGVTRNTINQAVRFGRPSIEGVLSEQRNAA